MRIKNKLKRIHISLEGKGEVYSEKEELEEMYLVQGLSVRQIASELGLHKSSVRDRFIKYGIQTRDVKEATILYHKLRTERLKNE
jgi:transposase